MSRLSGTFIAAHWVTLAIRLRCGTILSLFCAAVAVTVSRGLTKFTPLIMGDSG